jgi:hypothetical protein
MPVDRIARLYEGLTLKERAVLAFSYLTELNVQEVDRILATVPRKVYRMLDDEHTRWADGLRSMALFFGMEHWRFQARSLAASGFLMHMYNKPDVSEEEDESVGVCFDAWRSKRSAQNTRLTWRRSAVTATSKDRTGHLGQGQSTQSYWTR